MSSPATVIPDSHRDLLDATHTAIATTVDAGGYPQSTAVFYEYEGGELRFSITAARAKYRNLAERPRTSVFILDPANRYRSIEVRGDVTLADDADYAFRNRVARRYGFNAGSMDPPGTQRIVVTIRPVRVHVHG
jgi:PPOX class probable F420-dependent enzyme